MQNRAIADSALECIGHSILLGFWNSKARCNAPPGEYYTYSSPSRNLRLSIVPHLLKKQEILCRYETKLFLSIPYPRVFLPPHLTPSLKSFFRWQWFGHCVKKTPRSPFRAPGLLLQGSQAVWLWGMAYIMPPMPPMGSAPPWEPHKHLFFPRRWSAEW